MKKLIIISVFFSLLGALTYSVDAKEIAIQLPKQVTGEQLVSHIWDAAYAAFNTDFKKEANIETDYEHIYFPGGEQFTSISTIKKIMLTVTIPSGYGPLSFQAYIEPRKQYDSILLFSNHNRIDYSSFDKFVEHLYKSFKKY